ncbi:hypothetical protein K1719_031085 [Acacia pycnantha]|nr:hypothetical protein K1719_031085 [Acacia pycnantha]
MPDSRAILFRSRYFWKESILAFLWFCYLLVPYSVAERPQLAFLSSVLSSLAVSILSRRLAQPAESQTFSSLHTHAAHGTRFLSSSSSIGALQSPSKKSPSYAESDHRSATAVGVSRRFFLKVVRHCSVGSPLVLH